MEDIDRLLLVACNGVDSRKALLVAGLRVFEVHTCGKGTSGNLEERYFADVRLDVIFVDEQGCRILFLV